MVATVLVEVLERDPDTIRVVHTDSLNALPSNSPAAAAWRSCSAARNIKAALLVIVVDKPNTRIAELEYDVPTQV